MYYAFEKVNRSLSRTSSYLSGQSRLWILRVVVWWFLRRGAQGHQLYVDGRRVYSADELALIGLGPLQPQVGSLCFVLRPCVLSAIAGFRHETPLAPVYICRKKGSFETTKLTPPLSETPRLRGQPYWVPTGSGNSCSKSYNYHTPFNSQPVGPFARVNRYFFV